MTNKNSEDLNFIKDDQIYIYGLFDDSILKNIVPGFQKMIKEKREKRNAKIKININSRGGYAYVLKNLLSLVEYSKSLKIDVCTFAFGDAYSCASVLAASGTQGQRFIGNYTKHLVHLGQAGLVSVNDKQLERESERIKKHFNFVRSVYKKYACIKNLNKAIRDDSYYIYGSDIIKNGLADKILK